MPASSSPSQSHAFPLYLLPSLPFFRKRRESATSDSSISSSGSTTEPAPSPSQYLSGSVSHLRCTRCLSDLCFTSQIISKGFTGRHGRAYLVTPYETSLGADPGCLMNTNVHRPVPRQLVTGAHTVSDISCTTCGTILGWKYVAAEDDSQKYKVGKFILETKRVCRGICWEDQEGLAQHNGTRYLTAASEGDEMIEFDSQDEDECEDLFAGVWSPALARKRRRNRTTMAKGADEEDV